MGAKTKAATSGLTYSAYGFTLQSDFPCPELVEARGEPEVFLRRGAVPRLGLAARTGQHERYGTTGPNCIAVSVPGVASYHIRDGHEIIVEPAQGGLESDVRLWLFGSVFAVLLNQRNILPLHASAIETPGGAVLFAGPSGIGKSTLLLAFILRGYPMIADDVSGIVIDPHLGCVVVPGVARSKLWPDALERLGASSEGLQPVRPGTTKCVLPAEKYLSRRSTALNRVYLLTTADIHTPEIRRLDKLSGVETLLEHTYRPHFLDLTGIRATHFQAVAGLARRHPVLLATRPLHDGRIHHLADAIESDFLSKASRAVRPNSRRVSSLP